MKEGGRESEREGGTEGQREERNKREASELSVAADDSVSRQL